MFLNVIKTTKNDKYLLLKATWSFIKNKNKKKAMTKIFDNISPSLKLIFTTTTHMTLLTLQK